MELRKERTPVGHIRAGAVVAYSSDFVAITKAEPVGRGYVFEGISLLKTQTTVRFVALSSEEFDCYEFPIGKV